MTVAAEREIGRCVCPVCRSDRAHLRVSSKGLAYVVCNTCQVQAFARSDRSDELLRAMHRPDAAAPAAAPAASPAPAPAAEPTPTPTPDAPKARAWGWLGG